MNFYQHHIGDYLTATAHLSLLEHGAYRRMLDVYYSTEKPLPLDRKAVYRLALARSKEEQGAVDVILDEYFTETDSGWLNHRCEHEIGLCNKNRDNGKKGGRPSVKRNPNGTQDEPEQNPKETQTKPRCNPNETQTEPKTNPDVTQSIRPQYPIPNTQVNPPSLRDVPPMDSKNSKSGKSVQFSEWLASLKAKGEKAVSDHKPLWDFCEKVGIPADWVEIAWSRFVDRYQNDEKARRKRYTDWRRVFVRAVEENWFGLWFWSAKDGAFSLTTVGIASDMATREAA